MIQLSHSESNAIPQEEQVPSRLFLAVFYESLCLQHDVRMVNEVLEQRRDAGSYFSLGQTKDLAAVRKHNKTVSKYILK